ncbi:hypothetical protein SNE25_08975 [Mucilaginibacter sabulilitoris]|uniref:Uncharacterized protein n=1 Tax=Mucilaginibacter sabulilitoris TaxID=1173583 RepID=A0ABZ0TWZ9_9SPHI|nr:hypothetical protein [Mucilaginibacter sabulilitoris]WPU95650.1 hypothetical protein SNE25_08975 [Mucilaginibacter sabulilitoris]
MSLEKKEKYLATVKDLRSENFGRNWPFLILSEKLPDGQVYREYPDGHIELQEVLANGPNFEYKFIRY